MTPSPTSSTVASPIPTSTPALGYATDQEAADAEAGGSGLTICPAQGDVLLESTQVSVYGYGGGGCGPGGHFAVVVYVYRDAGGWHPYTWAGTQQPSLPNGSWGQSSFPRASGCVNVHQGPSLSAPVVTCLPASSLVFPAGRDHSPWNPPVWADQKVWWYVFRPTSPPGLSETGTPLGWMVLDYLVCGQDPNLSC